MEPDSYACKFYFLVPVQRDKRLITHFYSFQSRGTSIRQRIKSVNGLWPKGYRKRCKSLHIMRIKCLSIPSGCLSKPRTDRKNQSVCKWNTSVLLNCGLLLLKLSLLRSGDHYLHRQLYQFCNCRSSRPFLTNGKHVQSC